MRTLAVALCAGTIAALAACGDSKEQPSAKQAPVGKPVSKGTQLVGAWYRSVEDQDLVGVEFLTDGKVMLMNSGGPRGDIHTVTVDYAVMDGGRVRLSMPMGMTEVMGCRVDSTSLALEPETTGGEFEASRFSRLKSGETIGGVHRARMEAAAAAEKARQKAAGERAERVMVETTTLLRSAKLALVKDSLNVEGMGFAFEGPGPVFNGTAYQGGREVLLRRAQAVIDEPQGPDQPTRIRIRLGEVIGPIGAAPRQSLDMTFDVTGEPGALKTAWGGGVLKVDAAVYDGLAAHVAKENTARAAAIEEFMAPFGAYSRMEGQAVDPRGGQPSRVSLALLRQEGRPGFTVADLNRTPRPTAAQFTMPAEVQMYEGKLSLRLGPRDELTRDGSDDRTAVSGNLQMFGNRVVTLKSAETLSKAELDARRAGAAKMMDETMAAGVSLRGWLLDNQGENRTCRPVRVDLKSGPGRTIRGVFHSEALGARSEVTGRMAETLTGATVEMDARKTLAKMVTFGVNSLVYSLGMDVVDGRPVMTGQAGGDRSSLLELSMVTPAQVAAERAALEKMLGAGGAFPVRMDGSTGGSVRPLKLDLKLDGSVVTGSATYRGNKVVPLTGAIKEQDGFVVVEVSQGAPADVGTIRLWTRVDEEGILLSGYADWARMNPKTYSLMSFRSERKE